MSVGQPPLRVTFGQSPFRSDRLTGVVVVDNDCAREGRKCVRAHYARQRAREVELGELEGDVDNGGGRNEEMDSGVGQKLEHRRSGGRHLLEINPGRRNFLLPLDSPLTSISSSSHSSLFINDRGQYGDRLRA